MKLQFSPAPGQFLNIRLDGFYLRRPISVCDWDSSGVTILYRVVGGGTAALSRLQPGARLDVLAGLGNGFAVQNIPDRPTLVGGGIGVPPLYGLAKRLIHAGKRPAVVLGFKSAAEAFYEPQFRALGVSVHIATEDGSLGTKGFVTALMPGTGCALCLCLRAGANAESRLPPQPGRPVQFRGAYGLWFWRMYGLQLRNKIRV